MSFTIVTDVRLYQDETDLLVVWTSALAEGTLFQLYLNRLLVWSGTDRRVRIPYDSTTSQRIDVGSVGTADAHTDYSGSLPAVGGTGNRVTLTWSGGTYLDSSGLNDVAGFYVYSSSVAGGAVNYSAILADIPAYGSTFPLDGFGLGGFGDGGFGRADSSYSWTSKPLASGTWTFAVKPYDVARNLGTGSTTTATISAPPNPPAPNSSGVRLTYTYNAGTRVPTLNWLASP